MTLGCDRIVLMEDLWMGDTKCDGPGDEKMGLECSSYTNCTYGFLYELFCYSYTSSSGWPHLSLIFKISSYYFSSFSLVTNPLSSSQEMTRSEFSTFKSLSYCFISPISCYSYYDISYLLFSEYENFLNSSYWIFLFLFRISVYT